MTSRKGAKSADNLSGRRLKSQFARLLKGRTLDTALVRQLLSDQCHLRIGNTPPTIGKTAALLDLAQFVRMSDQIGQGYFDAWQCRNTLILELDCRMTCPRGLNVTVPFAAIVRMTDGMVDDIRIYIERSGPLPVEH